MCGLVQKRIVPAVGNGTVISHLVLQQEVNQLKMTVQSKKRELETLIQKVFGASTGSSLGIHDSEAKGYPKTTIRNKMYGTNYQCYKSSVSRTNPLRAISLLWSLFVLFCDI